MQVVDLQHLLGSFQWLVATSCLVVASWRLTSTWLPTDDPDPVERGLRAAVLTIACMALSVAVLGAFGWLGGPGLVLVGLVAWALSTRVAEPDAPAVAAGWGPWPLQAASGLLAADATLYLLVPPTNWDAMTYHLYLPARWIQEGLIFHVPTVFADAHAAYAPQNGALVFGWQMALTGFDTLCNLVQPALLIFGAIVLTRLAAELLTDSDNVGDDSLCLAAAAGLFVLLDPVRRWALTANVDVLMAVCWLAATYWSVRALRRGEASSALASGLATGLVAGSKLAGVLLALVPGLILLGVVFRRRWWLHGVATAALAILGGGWWYLRNLRLYGNPVFPLDFEVLGLQFDGAFRSSAMSDSFLGLDPSAWWASLPSALGWATCTVAIVGCLGLLAVVVGPGVRRRHRLAAAGALAFVAAWTYYCVALLPYNSQFRFLIPALALCCVGWVPVFRRLQTVGRPYALAAWALLATSLVALSPAPDLWRRPLTVFRQAGTVWIAAVLLAVVLLSVFVVLVVARRKRTSPGTASYAVLAVLLLVSIAAGGTVADRMRPGFIATADYAPHAMGILPFQDPQQVPTTIAYSGMNVPYALMGPGFRHRVIYVNTGGEAGDGFYEFWRRASEQADGAGLYPTHKPGIYRSPTDRPGPWLERLRANGVEAVALFRMPAVERPAHWLLDEAYPIERRWIRDAMRTQSRDAAGGRSAESDSDSSIGFRALMVSDLAEIYLVVP